MDQSSIGVSPSCGGTPRKNRRSWFGGHATKLEIAVDPREMRKTQPVLTEEIETLELNHFTRPPRVDFGTVRVGQTCVRHMRVHNPKDYEQDVVLEKFPFKKDFTVDHTEFTVDPEQMVILTLEWTPGEGCCCREMVLFRVDGAYRLQAYLIGRAEEAPKPKKKKAVRGKKPLSQIQPMANRTLMMRQQKAAQSTKGSENVCVAKPKPRQVASGPKKKRLGATPVEKVQLVHNTSDSTTQTTPPHSMIVPEDDTPDITIASLKTSRFFPDLTGIDSSTPIRRDTYAFGYGNHSPDVSNMTSGYSQFQETVTGGLIGHGRLNQHPAHSPICGDQRSQNSRRNQLNTPVRTETYLMAQTPRKSPLATPPHQQLTKIIKECSPKFEPIKNDTPVRRETYVADSCTGFKSTVSGELPSPAKDCTPLRRGTYTQHEASIVGLATPHIHCSSPEPENDENTPPKTAMPPATPSSMRRQSTYTKLKEPARGTLPEAPEPQEYHAGPPVCVRVPVINATYGESKLEEFTSYTTKSEQIEIITTEVTTTQVVCEENILSEHMVSKYTDPMCNGTSVHTATTIASTQVDVCSSTRTNEHIECVYETLTHKVSDEEFSDISQDEIAHPVKTQKGYDEEFSDLSFDESAPYGNTPQNVKDTDAVNLEHIEVEVPTALDNLSDSPPSYISSAGSPWKELTQAKDQGQVHFSSSDSESEEFEDSLAVLEVVKAVIDRGEEEESEDEFYDTNEDLNNSFIVSPEIGSSPPNPVLKTVHTQPKNQFSDSSEQAVLPCDSTENKVSSALPSPQLVTINPCSGDREQMDVPDSSASDNHIPSIKNYISPVQPSPEHDSAQDRLDVPVSSTSEDHIDFSTVPSPMAVLQNSVAHEEVIKELTTVKTSLNNCLTSPSDREKRESGLFFVPFSTNDGNVSIKELPRLQGTRRASSLTVTKEKPTVLIRPQDGGDTHVSKRLFPTDDKPLRNVPNVASREAVPKSQLKSSARISGNSVKDRSSSGPSRKRKSHEGKEKDSNISDRNSTRPAKPSGYGVKTILSPCKNRLRPFPRSDTQQNRPAVQRSAPSGQVCQSPLKRRSGSKADLLPAAARAKRQRKDPKKPDNAPTKRLTRTEQLRIQATHGQKSKRPSTSEAKKTLIKKAPTKGVAMSKLILLKTNNKAAPPKHPMAFAAKNVYYDERWIEKQDHGFVKWLNFILTPPDVYFDAKKPTKIDAGRLSMEVSSGSRVDVTHAPSKEALSFRAYTARRRMNRLRRAACMLYQSDRFIGLIQKLEVEIENRRLAVRKDRKLRADFGIRQRVLEMLLSYNPLWLRIGLETVYGEMLPLISNTDVITLSKFVLTRLLGNPDIAQQYAHPTVPHLYRDGYDEAVAQFSLKKFLLLVCFLDLAKQQRIIEHDPCLFCKDADFKASRDILLQFSKDLLSGEGDLTKHLGYLGYTVSHSQTYLDEYDFGVNTLATDLRDGVRLVRVMELLSGEFAFSKQLRVPPISRLQKIHNTEIMIKCLKDRSVDLTSSHGGKVEARDLVDGHREKTLALLWKIIFNFQVEVVLNIEQLKSEIAFLKENLQVQVNLDALMQDQAGDLGLPRHCRGNDIPEQYLKSKHLRLLLEWCRVVCAYYSMKIENFTVSFSDGRALCFLVHHYHPALLPNQDIRTETTQTYMGDGADTSLQGSDCDDSFTFASAYKPDSWEQLLTNERDNFKLLYQKVSELGGVPLILKHSDMSNTIPDEKVVITYVSYLCARLLDIREEVRAARVIQAAWRKHRLKRKRQHYQDRQKSVVILQRAVRDFLKRRREVRRAAAAVRVQAWWRGIMACKAVAAIRQQKVLAAQIKAATHIQAVLRSFLVQRNIRRMEACAVRIQSWWRGQRVQKQYWQLQKAACVCQQTYRAKMTGRHQRAVFIQQRAAVVCLQRFCRGWLARRAARSRLRTVLLIQAAWKGQLVRDHLRKSNHASQVIQQWFRSLLQMRKERREYLQKQAAAVCIQKHVRRYQAQMLLQQKRDAAVTIQAAVRCCLAKRRYKELRTAVCSIQVWYRAHVVGQRCREHYRNTLQSVVMLQACIRGWHCRQLLKQHQAARCIQATYRMHTEKRKFDTLKRAAITIQTAVRMYNQRKQYTYMKACVSTIQQYWRAVLKGREQRQQYLQLLQQRSDAAVKIQAEYRRYQAQQEFAQQRRAALSIQRWYRARQQRQRFLQQQAACRLIQTWYRSWQDCRRVQREYQQVRSAVVKLQSVWRAVKARRAYSEAVACVIRLQSVWRMHQARRGYMTQLAATYIIQMRWRTHLQAKRQRNRYVIMKQAAVKIQSAWRMFQQQQNFELCRKAAVSIQSCYRRHKAVTRYQNMKTAAVTLQRTYRAQLAMRKQREQYQKTLKACTLIQATVRSWIQRKQFIQQKNAAVKIQAAFKAIQQHRRYHTQKNAAILIQRWIKARSAGQKQRAEYLQIRNHVIHLQAVIRGHLVHRWFMKQRRAAVLLQACIRGHQQRKAYQHMLAAVNNIQKYVRGWLLMKKSRTMFLKQRQSAVSIQSHVRGYLKRQSFRRQKAATLIIQSHMRRCLAQRNYRTKMKAVNTLQGHMRAWLCMKHQVRQYQSMQSAAMTLQKYYRCCVARRQYLVTRNAAVTIQAGVRRWLAQKDYQQKHKAVRMLQQHVRAWLAMKKQQKSYSETKQAACVVQAHVRGYLTRCSYLRTKRAILVIQTFTRRILAVKAYQQQMQAVLVLQRMVKAWVAMRRERAAYLCKKKAVVLIQKHVRRQIKQKQYRASRSAAITVQSYWRMREARKQYLTCKTAATTIQRYTRAWLAGRHQQAKFREIQNATLCLQSAFRGMQARKAVRRLRAVIYIQSCVKGHLCRKKLKEQHRFCTAIQSAWRRYCAVKQYQAYRAAAIKVQQAFRAWRLAKQVQRAYHIKRGATITLQAAWRGYWCRKSLRLQHAAALVLQTAYRRHLALVRYTAVRKAVTAIQGWWRTQKVIQTHKHKYTQMQESVRKIQATVRGWLVRRNVNHMISSAVIIQKYTKCFLVRRRYLRMYQAAVIIQQAYQAKKLMTCQRQVYLQQRAAAVTIQSWLRGCCQRQLLAKQAQAATVVQACFRRYQQQHSYQKLMKVTECIQKWYRSVMLTRATRRQYHVTRGAIITMQAAVRGFIARCQYRRIKAAQLIQAQWRCHRQCRQYRKIQHATVVLQSFFRMVKLRKSYSCRRDAAILLQRRLRAAIQAKQDRHRFLTLKHSALTIQSWYKCVVQKRSYCTLRRGVIALQAIVKGQQQRQRFVSQCRAVLCIQRHYRAQRQTTVSRQQYLHKRHAVVTIQKAYRTYIIRKQAKRVQAVVKIQTIVRMWRQRQRFRQTLQAIRTIQSYYHARMVREQFLREKYGAICIQQWFRSVRLTRCVREEYLSKRSSAIMIQSVYRGHLVRKAARRVKAATMIQSYYRGHRSRIHYKCTRVKVIKCQAVVRSWLESRRSRLLLQQQEAARIIQRAYRSHYERRMVQVQRVARQLYLEDFAVTVKRHLSVILIQRLYRRHRVLRVAQGQLQSVLVIQHWMRGCLCRLRYLRLRRCMITLQQAYRRYLENRHRHVIVIQAAVRGWLERRRLCYKHWCAVKIQALWHGYRVRKTVKCKKLKEARKRVAEANRVATPEQTLRSRTHSALEYLLHCKYVSYVQGNVKDLEVGTRLSAECCEELVQRDAVGILYKLIASCNRSLPHMDIIYHSVRILFNLAKYEQTVDAVFYAEGCEDILLQQLMIYREKGTHIFTSVCMLLGVLAYNPLLRQMMTDNQKFVEGIQSIHALVQRKHSMEEKRKITKTRASASKSFYSAPQPLTPSKRPRLRPAWVLRRDRVQETTDPLQAITFLLNCLHITPKGGSTGIRDRHNMTFC